MRRRKQIKRVMLPEISLTPLIDVALTLLVIFMLTTPMLQTTLDTKLPQGKGSSSQQSNQAVEICVDKSGLIYIDNKIISKQNLKKELTQLLKNGSIANVKADGQVAYDHVAYVLDLLNNFTGTKVCLVLQREL